MFACPLKALLHIDCPGCGMQRSFIALLRGDVAGSFALHPATMPLLVMLVFTALHIRFKFRHGAAVIIILYTAIAIMTAVFYIYKITHKLL